MQTYTILLQVQSVLTVLGVHRVWVLRNSSCTFFSLPFCIKNSTEQLLHTLKIDEFLHGPVKFYSGTPVGTATYVGMAVEKCGHVMECISLCAWHFLLCTLSAGAFMH